MASLWQILVPTVRNNGNPIRTRCHKVWDEKVRAIAGGLTILKPAKGQWLDNSGSLYSERMIPVLIICDDKDILKISDITAKHYEQKAVFVAKLSDDARIIHYDGTYKRERR